MDFLSVLVGPQFGLENLAKNPREHCQIWPRHEGEEAWSMKVPH